MSLWVQTTDAVELRPNFTEDDLQTVIRAVYKQVLGNAYLLESDRLVNAESLLRNGDITVRGFVRLVGQSELYQSQFFENSSQYRFIELNCKHFLGRAPQDQVEISRHVLIYNEQGYEADINYYIDSVEYTAAFGENTVPYPRNTSSQVGSKNVDFNRTFSLFRGDATSDSGKSARLISDLASNLPSKITAPAKRSGNVSNTGKRFRIATQKAGSGNNYRRSNFTYEVGYAQLSQKIQNIQRMGGKILSITEVTN
ncbi:Phycobilisome 32.1 kDa linker polypeptide, phycocyanin-associated, rod [Hyella patelloides LEGE 07179]|uniref:Phycobilisome 32.1 kDa linker polypeptide, phycocyanin-associated, rod n=1 Tax=Hyella patelloides LEGE 07179 TaxID=945734 RepID=A0A563W541_9CYAN|nr:phycobilisome linker polypeptide [Hyella patelloides]VEP18785.1 Phycobilisome 32.1 kDa linker polypeptide, phycocyanin-associated, rod [Hyella patelloides LEGE 07179]